MKVVGVREVKAQLSEVLDEAQGEQVIVTRHGKPVAVLSGVAGFDMEDVLLMLDPSFWKMIERRRASGKPTVPLEEARRRLGLEPASKRRGRTSR
ncbi:MAG: type II toxin-antitoxin system Phd/YefM family antitoxin [Myxococcota bacterium]